MAIRWIGSKALLATLVLILPPLAQAHDFWIEPSNFNPKPDERVSISERFGDRFEGVSVQRTNARIERFVAVGPDGEHPIPGPDGSDPIGTTQFSKPGVYVIGYRNTPRMVEFEPVKFEHYLAEKGLMDILDLRKTRGMTDNVQREAFSHCLKTLIRVGDAPGTDRVLGLKYELIAESPLAGHGPQPQIFRVLYEGKPLKGALVTATRRHAPSDILYARSDAEGRVKFVLKDAGDWALVTVHMIEAPKTLQAVWESFWASLTFQLP